MRNLIHAILFLLYPLFCTAQTNADSLRTTLNNIQVTRQILEQRLNEITRAAALDSNRILVTSEWIIRNSGDDSLMEFRGRAYFAIGRMYTMLSEYEDAVRNLTLALEIAEKGNFVKIQAEALNALGSVYNSNEQFAKAQELYNQSYDVANSVNFEIGMSRALFNLGQLLLNKEKLSPATLSLSRDLTMRSLAIARSIGDTGSIINQARGLATIYSLMRNYDSALLMLRYAEKLLPGNNRDLAYISHFSKMAKLFNDKKDYPAAIKYYQTGLSLAKETELPRLLCMYYSGLAETFENMGDFRKANHYNLLNIRMHDALVSRENFVAAADIRNKYERAQKDNDILRLAAANRKKSALNNLLAGAAIGLFLIVFLGYLNFKSRVKIAKQQEELQAQKILQLEKDRQLVSIDAMLKGQEEERNRIAKDLHDGLGGILSGTKLSFVNLKESLMPRPEYDQQFTRSLSMLDNAIGDLRKIAQNLMPQALEKFGLPEALRDFCDSVQGTTGINVEFRQFGTARKPDNNVAIYIYRIVQELVNNAVKHARPASIFVQLTMNKDSMAITIEDDGHGFDKNILAGSKGAGMSNINYRVQYLNGTTDIISSPGKGTSVNIDLKV